MEPSNVLAFDLTEHHARRLIAEICDEAGDRLIFTDHAMTQMRKRKVTRTQVIRCLRNGHAIEGPSRDIKGNWKLTLEVFSAGETLKVVVALDYKPSLGNYAIVITAFFGMKS